MVFVALLFIVVICFIIYIARSSNELYSFGKKSAGIEEENKWREILVNKEREKEIENLVKDPANKEHIFETLHDNLINALGEDYKSVLHGDGTFLWNETTTYEVNFGYWTKELLLSKEGFVSERAFSRGYCADGGSPKKVDYKIDLVHECEKNLRLHHPELHLCYMRRTSWNPIRFRFPFQYYNYSKPELMTLWYDQ